MSQALRPCGKPATHADSLLAYFRDSFLVTLRQAAGEVIRHSGWLDELTRAAGECFDELAGLTARKGFAQEVIDEEMRKIGVSVRRLEEQLSKTEWLIGDQYTLADICNYAIAGGMQFGFPEFVNAKDTPNLLAWIEKIAARPAAIKMYTEVPSEFARPQADAAKA